MDARSIAATAANGGFLTAATDLDCWDTVPDYAFNPAPYKSRVYRGFVKGATQQPLIYGPNIKDWPELGALTENILLKVASKILDDVTTTDELIPSGETSSYRSNPLGLAEFTLSRRDHGYVGRSKATSELEKRRVERGDVSELVSVFERIQQIVGQENVQPLDTEIGSMIYAVKRRRLSARAGGELSASDWWTGKYCPGNMPPSVTVPTLSTGACYRSRWQSNLLLKWVTISIFPPFAAR